MGENTKLLIVDDDVNFGYTLSKVLAKKGYETTTAKDGFRALELIKENEFDTVLMDIKMPAMNGVETYKKIKEIRPSTIVIMMSAFSVADLIREAVKEGVYAVIRKPFDMDEAIKIIDEVSKREPRSEYCVQGKRRKEEVK